MLTRFKSIFELMDMFDTEQKCIDFLEKTRWTEGVVSPFDPSAIVYPSKTLKNTYKCKSTQKYFNVKTDTLFHGTRISLRKWFVAIYICTSHKKGISSMQLSRDLGVTQKTAWHMLHRIRECFGDNSEEQLSGTIEADEAFVGGKNKNRHADKKVKNAQGRSFKDKTPVLGMVQRATKDNPKKIKLIVIESTSTEQIQPLIGEYVAKDSTFYSDEWVAYQGLHKRYNHQYIDHSKGEYVNGEIHTNTIEGAWKGLKMSITATYHRVSKKHLQRYCNEVQFKYNHMTLSISDAFNAFFENIENRLTYKMAIS